MLRACARARGWSKIQLGGGIAVDVKTDGFPHELLRHAEELGKIPHIRVAGGDSRVQLAAGDQAVDCPFVRAVFVPLPGVLRGAARVKAAGFAVSQLMGKVNPKGAGALQNIFVYTDAALPRCELNRYRTICGQICTQDLNAMLLRKTV